MTGQGFENEMGAILSLDGTWAFRLGKADDWQTIQTPACWEAQGFSKHIDGPACYRRSIVIPEAWKNQRIQLELDAASYAASIRINHKPAGHHLGLWDAFGCDVTDLAIPGQANEIEIQLYKPGTHYPMRQCLAGFLPDVATTFGGLWQPVRLRAMRAGLRGLHIAPDLEAEGFRIRCRAQVWEYFPDLAWQVAVYDSQGELTSRTLPYSAGGKLDVRLALPGLTWWSPEQPALYRLVVSLTSRGEPIARAARRTGFRRLSTDGNQLHLNGKPFMLRGILSWGWEPERIAPTYTRQQAQAEIQRVRALGFNLIKLCLFVPNPDYFEAADEAGMLLWQELPMWLPEVSPRLRRQTPREYAAIVSQIQHHPSAALYSLGCELGQAVDADLLSRLDRTVRGATAGVLVCDNSGSGESYGGLETDTADFSDYHPYYDLHFFEPLLDHWRRDWQPARPCLFGEFCDADTFRSPEQVIQAHGGSPPWWMTADNPTAAWREETQALITARERLAQAELPSVRSEPPVRSEPLSAEAITQVSYAQAQVVRKYTLEALRRRNGMGGYVITGLRDTPIATSGVWDDQSVRGEPLPPKWEASAFRLVNDDTVLCLDTGRRRRWRFGGDRPDRLDGHNFWSGDQAVWTVILHSSRRDWPAGSQMTWRLAFQASGETISRGGAQCAEYLRAGMPGAVGIISCRLPAVSHPVELCLGITLDGASDSVANQWPMWVYPRLQPFPAQVAIQDPGRLLDEAGDWLTPAARVNDRNELSRYQAVLTTVWTQDTARFIRGGGRALVWQTANGPFPARRGPFWREAIKLFYPHPLWEQFPQRGYADLQFFGLACDAAVDSQAAQQAHPDLDEVKPILRRLDARAYQVTDYLCEARLGKGMLLMCALNLVGGSGAQPFGWQRNVAGSALLQAMLGYLITAA